MTNREIVERLLAAREVSAKHFRTTDEHYEFPKVMGELAHHPFMTVLNQAQLLHVAAIEGDANAGIELDRLLATLSVEDAALILEYNSRSNEV